MAITDVRDLFKDKEKAKKTASSSITDVRDLFLTEEKLNNFYNSFQSRLDNWTNESNSLRTYTESYYNNRDLSSFGLNSSQAWKDKVASKNKWLTEEADSINSFLDEYSRYFDSDAISKIRSAFSEASSTQGKILEQADADIEFWNKFKDENEYQDYYFSNKYDGKSYTDVLKALESAQGKEKDWLSKNSQYYMSSKEAQTEIDKLSKTKSEYDAIQTELTNLTSQLTNAYRRAGYGADVEKMVESNSRVIKLKGQLGDYDNDGTANRLAELTEIKGQAILKENKKSLEAEAKNDKDYNSYVTLGESKGLTMENKWFEPNGSGGINVFERGYADYIVGIRNGKIVIAGTDADWYAKHMTDDQYKNYVYFLGKYGEDKASEYLDTIKYELNTKQALDIQEYLDGTVILPQLFGFAAGLESFGENMKGLFSDGYEAPSATQIASGLVREDQGTIGRVTYDLANTTGHMLPSILGSAFATALLGPAGLGVAGATTAGAIGQGVGAGLTGLSSMGGARQEMLNLGYSNAQATTYGFLTGASEAGLQYALGGIGKLGGALTDDAVKAIAKGINSAGVKFAIEFGADMVSEGLEESLQEILTPFFKKLVTGKNEGVDWGQVSYSGMLGALSAGVLNGIGAVGTRAGELSTARQIKGNESQIARLKEVGNTFSADTLANKLASKVTDKTGAWKIADVIHEMKGTLSEQNVADIKYQLVRSGMVESDADTISEWLAKAVDGDYLTASQRKALDNNPIISRVFKKVIIDQNSTVNQRLQALMDFEGTGGTAGIDYSAIAKSQSKEAITGRINFRNAIENAKQEAIKSEYGIGRSASNNAFLDNMVSEAKKAVANGKVNEGGVTTDTTTGRKIDIKKVTNTDGKTATFSLADGSTISSKNVEYADEDEGILYEGAISLGYDANTTNVIINGRNAVADMPVMAYINGVEEAIEYGKVGYPMDKISTEGFYAKLPKSMQKFAYNLGKEQAVKDTDSAQAKVNAGKGKVEQARKGEVIISTKSGLTERQSASLTTLGKMVADITHNKVYIFESVEKTINGKKTRVFAQDTAGFKAGTPADNGFYNRATGEIFIDLHAGMNGEGVILWTAAHELTHFIRQWSPAKFKVLADFLMAEYGKKGVDVQTLIDNKILESKRKKLTRDQAYEEVVADSMQTMFTDTDLASKLERLKNKDKGLWNKIKQFFRDLYKRITEAYKGLDPQTDEAKLVHEMGNTIEKLSDLFAEALVDAGNTYANVDIQAVASGEVDIDGNASTHAMSIRSMAEGAGLSFEYDEKTGQIKILDMFNGTEVTSVTAEQIKDAPLGNIVSIAKQNGFISDAEAKKQYGFLADLVNLCLNYKENFTMVWEIAGTQVFSAIKANSDTQYGKTIDFSTVCKKTQQVINVISETQKKLKRGLTKDEIKNIVYYETGKAGEPTPCPVCYVFSRWMGIGGILQQMADFQKKYEGATETDMRNFINDVESEIIKHANTPNKSGKLKAEFFDKNGKPKFGTVIADLKAKANSKIKSADIRLKIQETETLLAKADLKDKAKLQKTLNRLNNKLAKEGDILDAKLKEAEAILSRYEEYQWLTKTYMDEVKAEDGTHLGWKLDENFKPVDEDVLWDLREGSRFATEYPKSWLYRTTKGCSAGKAILPYSDARVGETIQGVAFSNVKDILIGENNAFLNGDTKAQADYVTKAIKKQLAQNLIGGMRYQSTSDFRYEYGSDYLITFLEMQAIGAKVQLYTKVIEAVDFLCTMGAEVNMSVMPLNDGYIELEDGRKQLVFSSVTGINSEAAIAKSKQYDNAQLILVGISDEHIRLALEGDDVNGDVVTFVIPFHGSGNTVKAIQELMDLLGENLDVTKAQDYSLVQTDHFAKNRTAEQTALWELRKKIISRSYKKDGKSVSWDGKLTPAEEALLNSENGSKYLKDLYNRFYVDKTADEYGVALSTAQAEQIFPYEYWDKTLTYAEADRNGERFKDYCATMGIVPRFSGVDSSGKALGYGNFTNTKGYWKLLIDRKMYNNDGTYHNPGKINVSNFKVETLDPAWGSATYGDVMQKDTNPKKTNAIVENVIRQIEEKEMGNIMFSPRGDVLSWDVAWDSDNYSSIKDQLRAHLDEVNSMQPVASINYDKAKGKPYNEQLDEILRTKFGYKIERQDHGSIIFDSKAIAGMRKYVESDAEAAAVIASPYILKRGKAISGHKDHKGRGYPAVVYAAPATLNGEVGNVAVAVLYGSARRIHSLRVLTPSGKEFVLVNIKNTELQNVGSATTSGVEPTISSVLSGNRIAQNPDSVNSLDEISFSERKEAPPTKTEKAYKLMRLVDGKLYPLFIGNNEEVRVGTWYNADSPNLSQLKNLAPGTHLVDMKTGEAMTWDEYAEKHIPKKNGKPTRSKPNVDDVHWANDNGCRFMHIEEKAGGKSEGTMLKKYGDTRAYYNWGVNGSSKTESGEGSASLYALRPGWHFGEVPSMHQIGYDGEGGETVRLDNQVWVEVEMSADVDYNAEAEANWSGDIPTHIPTNGYYRFATNPTQKKTKGGDTANDATKADWYVAGAFKVNRIMSDYEADAIVENYNKKNGKNIPLDYRRNYGRVFNAETMSIEDRVMFSERVLMGSLFSGGGTLEAGLAYQMLDKQFGVEYDGKIASVYADNHGDHIYVGRVEDFDISKHKDIFYLHASPVCHNFSKAKHGAKELKMDIDSAKATAKHLETAMPQVFTVENAPGYRKSQSLKIITDKLTELGYKWDVDVYNSADYGSATSRNRVILRAVKDGELPAKPTKQSRTNSWDKVTRDLWNTLPKSNLRPSFISAIENTPSLPILDANGKVNVNKPLLILTTTSGHTVTYCWEGEICPTLTTKCGEAKLVMPDGNIYAVTPEFMGRIQGLPTDYKYPTEKTRAFTIIGNGIPTHLTKAVIGGVLDSAYEQTHDGDILYSERTENATDNRSLLANALESVAQNDGERYWLSQYKEKIASLNEEQKQLAKLRAEIYKARFTKGADRSNLPALEKKADALANKINRADKKLLELEASNVLKKVVERERAKAYQLGKAKLDEYRKDRAESKARSYYRPRIEKIVNDLRNRLEHPSAKTAIPEAFGASVARALSAFNFTTYDKDGNPKPSKANVSRFEAQEALKDLANQLATNSIESEYGQLDIPPEMKAWIEEVATYFEAAENLAKDEFIINKMNEVQLKNIYKFIRSLQTAINKAGKYYTNASYDVASDAKSTMDYVGQLPTDVNETLHKASKMFKWDFASPVTVFDRFGEGGKHVYQMLVNGQSKMAYNVQEVLDFVEKAYTEKEAREWQEKLVPVTIGGVEYNVTVEMLMGLHCLLKQEDSRNHILNGGGIRFADVKNKGKVKRFQNIFFNEIDAMAVESALDAIPRAKEVAEAMQKFMEETGSAWGNEVSMIRFGYHAFTTKGYYPIRTIKAGSEYEAQQKRANIYALLNKSFTKERIEGANNAVIVDGIFSVFNNHMAEMALYNAWALPVIDTIKWFNYKETQDIDAKVAEKSVHETFRLAYGNYADEYVRRLLESINSQTDGGLSEGFAFRQLRMVNRVAVAWNVRVALQQPFSISRAYELINPKYVTPLVGKARDVAYEEMLANSGIAKWKSMGYYDVDVSRPLETQVKKNATAADKFTEVGMKAAEDGDSFTWTALWNACKKETAEKNPGLDSKALLEKTAERFDDIVLRTQVVDSVLAKPQWMRSNNFLFRSTSAFMSEPLTSYNALLRQADKYARDVATKGVKFATKNNIKGIARATTVFVFTQLLNALVTAPLDAFRDDDDYETYLEKVLANFKENAFGNLMPWNMLPWISDVADYLLYGRTDRSDMAYAVNVIDLARGIYNLADNYSYQKLHNTFNKALSVASQTSGFAVSNIWRDAIAVWNAVAGELGYGELKYQTKADTSSEGYKRMYEALFNGNEDRAEYLYGQLLSNEVEEESIYNGLTKLVREAFKNGEITEEEAIERMMAIIGFTGKVDSEGNAPTENDVYWQVDKWKYTNENGGDSKGYSKYDDIFTAMEDGDPTASIEWHVEKLANEYYAEAKAKAEQEGKTLSESKAKREAESKAKSTIKSAITSYWKPKYLEAYKNKDDEEMKRIRLMLRDTKLYGGTSDIMDTIKGWLKD